MYFPDDQHKLRVELDTKQCDLTARETERFYEGLRPLERTVRPFPVSDLYITVRRHPRSKDYHVTTALHVPSRTLFTGERHDSDAYTAFERCIRKLVGKIEAHKDQLASKHELSKSAAGTRHVVLPEYEPHLEALQDAVQAGDYRAFREQMEVYYEPVRMRVGRWVRRYPPLQAQIGRNLSIDDVVEDVFFTAFDRFRARSELRLGDWLETLIREATRSLVRSPEAETESVSFARTYSET